MTRTTINTNAFRALIAILATFALTTQSSLIVSHANAAAKKTSCAKKAKKHPKKTLAKQRTGRAQSAF